MTVLLSSLASKEPYRTVDAVTMIGSRETPLVHLRMLKAIGRMVCDKGKRFRSGGAPGADDESYQGYRTSSNYDPKRTEVFLPRKRFNGYAANPAEGFYNAKAAPNWALAKELAIIARGSENGLNDWGIDLHTRNAYQVLGRNLRSLSECVYLYATPVANNMKVAGGTNTAFQLAGWFNVPVFNIYHTVVFNKMLAELQSHFTPKELGEFHDSFVQ